MTDLQAWREGEGDMSELRRARLIVEVVNDGDIEEVLRDLTEALMRTGHGPRISLHVDDDPAQLPRKLGTTTADPMTLLRPFPSRKPNKSSPTEDEAMSA